MMRRKEKEVADRQQIDDIIRRAPFCRLAMIDGTEPYIVPLCFGFDGQVLYFHSAQEGRKVDALRRNSRVCFEIDCDLKLKRGAQACEWGLRYTSVIGWGHAMFIEDVAAKRHALGWIMAHYDREGHEFSEGEVARTAVIRVEIDQVTAKSAV